MFKSFFKNITLVGLAGIALIYAGETAEYSSWAPVLIIVGAAIVALLLINRVDKKAPEPSDYLFEGHCDPLSFLNKFRHQGNKLPENALVYDMLEAAALLDAGEIEAATALIARVEPGRLPDSADGAFFYHLNLLGLAAARGEPTEIRCNIERIQSMAVKKAIALRVEDITRLYQAIALKMEGYLAESETILKELSLNLDNRRVRVYALYHLALLAQTLYDERTVKQYLNIVDFEGDKLFIAEDARRRLAALY